jgi:hypothetical protein
MVTADNRGNKSVTEVIKMVAMVTGICLSVTSTSNTLATI